MRKVIGVVLIVGLCPVLLAESNPTASAKTATGSFKGIAALRPLSFEDLLARAAPQQTPPSLHQNSTGPALPAVGNGKSRTLAYVGGALMTVGIILAATAGDTATVTFTDPFSGNTSVIEASRVNNGQRWGGVGLAGAGELLLWHNLSNKN